MQYIPFSPRTPLIILELLVTAGVLGTFDQVGDTPVLVSSGRVSLVFAADDALITGWIGCDNVGSAVAEVRLCDS